MDPWTYYNSMPGLRSLRSGDNWVFRFHRLRDAGDAIFENLNLHLLMESPDDWYLEGQVFAFSDAGTTMEWNYVRRPSPDLLPPSGYVLVTESDYRRLVMK